MHIINQDRDRIVEFTGEQPLIGIEVPELPGTYALVLGDEILGAYDSAEEVSKEISRIMHSTHSIIALTGYFPY